MLVKKRKNPKFCLGGWKSYVGYIMRMIRRNANLEGYEAMNTKTKTKPKKKIRDEIDDSDMEFELKELSEYRQSYSMYDM